MTAVVASSLAESARQRAEEAEREREAADRARAELEELSRERERMQGEVIEAEALRRSDELKTALLRSVSHDLRTPLTSVIAAGAALDSPNLTEAERTELSEAVVGEGQRLSRLVENLLDVSRLETGKAEPHREQVDLAEVLEAARDSLGLDRDGFRISGEAGLPTLRADPAQLERAFANLIENGVRHSGGRPVLADCRMVEGRVIVRVVDQGPGIPESEWERIFEPFYRANGAARRLRARPRDRQGVRRGQRRDDRNRVAPRPGLGLRRLLRRDRGRRALSDATRVLVCDDEPQILRALRVILRDAGFEAVTTSSGEEALDAAAVRPPAAAIVDLMLPDIDGVEVTERLREWSEIPIIVLSAVGEEEEKVRALAAGADDYVTKPFGPPELIARLQAALRRARPEESEPVISADGIEIDLAARSVRRDGEEVHLTPTEFELLRALAVNRGRLMTHRNLLVEVWGVEYEDDLQVLRAHVANLRRKIEPEDGPRYIRTDPGVGYRFSA